MATVLILQPGIRQYRAPLFEQLRHELAERGHDLHLHYPGLGRRASSEQDQDDLPWAVHTSAYRLPGSGDAVLWMPIIELGRQSDLVIVPEFSGWLHTYQLLSQRRSHFTLACWGHGPSVDDHARNGLTRAIRRRTAPRFDWWFSYTAGSTERLKLAGVAPDRITTLFNTMDVGALRRRIEANSDRLAEFNRQHGLNGATALFLGALRAEKDPELLLDVGARVADEVPDFRLLVGGAGPEQSVITEAADRYEWLVYLGPIFSDDKALALAAADVMLQPTRLGLVVLDGFAAGVPIATFDEAHHGPEAEYLHHGIQGIRVSGQDPRQLATATAALLQDESRLAQLGRAAWSTGSEHLLEGMVDRFAAGIENALSSA